MKTVFVGAVEGSLEALAAICAAGHVPALVVTLPPQLSGRHSDFADLAPTAEKYGVPVHHTSRSDSEETLKVLREVDPDLILVIGWSQICGPDFRAIPRLGCIGFHPLPCRACAAEVSSPGRSSWVKPKLAQPCSGLVRAWTMARSQLRCGTTSTRKRSLLVNSMTVSGTQCRRCCRPC